MRSSQHAWSGFVCLLFLAAFLPHSSSAQASCTSITNLSLPHSHVLSAQVIPAGTFSTTQVSSPIFKQLPAFCRVIVQAQPSADSQIMIEVWLPVTGWTGRFLGRGNGGFAGWIDYTGMANAVLYGYATAATDTGHTGTVSDASWALGHPQKIIDFGYRAVHEMSISSKAVVLDFYGLAPHYSYFAACSDGGREALMEAQRYPLDYDGILAGDPANNWTHLMSKGAIDAQALLINPSSYISASKIPAITSAVLAACNQGVTTGYLNDPSQCKFNPAVMLCHGAETDQCLTQAEVATMSRLYASAFDANNLLVFPGLPPGGEDGINGWSSWITGSAPGKSGMFSYIQGFFKDMVYQNPNWDFKTFTLDQGLKDAIAQTGAVLDANTPNLSVFASKGHRLILYQGWDDPAISAQSTINYYNSVVTTLGASSTNSTVRLYMVPGMQHCWGGPGPTNFGAGGPAANVVGNDAQHSIYKALETWVEKRIPPQAIITSGTVNDTVLGTVQITRPLCAYPLIAKYKGTGDSTTATNWACAAK